MRDAKGAVVLHSGNLSAIDGVDALADGWQQLNQQPLPPTVAQGINDYYADTFMPEYNERTGRSQSPTSLMPVSNAGKYIQYYYTAQSGTREEALELRDAGDGSAYSAAHAAFHPYFKRLVDAVHYEDVLVIDNDGNVVYSAYNRTDLGISLKEGPYKESSLADAYHAAMATGDPSSAEIRDLEGWAPAFDRPVIWIVSPIGDENGLHGAIAAEISLDQLNRMVTSNNNWQALGLGETGEIYLAGRDELMRSISRALVEDPSTYAQKVIANGTPADIANRAVEHMQTSGIQPVPTEAVRAALGGESGTMVAKEYIGKESVVAYAPLHVDELDWVIVVRIEASEAFAPVSKFTRNLLLSTLGILLGTSIISLLLAQVFTRPVRGLTEAADAVAAGNYDVAVPTGSRDEFGELGAAFNNMAASLKTKQAIIDQQRVENNKLMSTLMPENVAQRYLKGESAISEQHDNVAVVYAELVGFDEYARGLTPEEEVAQLNALLSGFDDAAEAAGIERVRTLRNGYLAASGILVPRIDNARRAVDFAVEMRKIVDRFNAQNNTKIDVRAGVDAGTVTSGLVARTNLAYDLWGDAVSIAYRARNVSNAPGVYVSDAIHDSLQDVFTFDEAGTVELNGAKQAVWRVAD